MLRKLKIKTRYQDFFWYLFAHRKLNNLNGILTCYVKNNYDRIQAVINLFAFLSGKMLYTHANLLFFKYYRRNPINNSTFKENNKSFQVVFKVNKRR